MNLVFKSLADLTETLAEANVKADGEIPGMARLLAERELPCGAVDGWMRMQGLADWLRLMATSSTDHVATTMLQWASDVEATRAAAGEGMAWPPIKTAPKYTPIRLYAQGGGFYDEDFNPSGSVEGHWSDDTHWCGAFWNPEQDCWDRRDGIVPTHWMPLPAAPGVSAAPPTEPAVVAVPWQTREESNALLHAEYRGALSVGMSWHQFNDYTHAVQFAALAKANAKLAEAGVAVKLQGEQL